MISTPSAAALRGEAAQRRHVVRVAAALFVQHRRDVLRLPVVEEPLHVAHRLGFAFDEHRFVADRLLLLVDRADLRVHHLGADLHVADRVIAVGLGIALPDRHRNAPSARASRAGSSCCARRRTRCRTRRRRCRSCPARRSACRPRRRTFRAPSSALREMHRGRQAVDAGADDDVVGVCGEGRHRHDLQSGLQKVVPQCAAARSASGRKCMRRPARSALCALRPPSTGSA